MTESIVELRKFAADLTRCLHNRMEQSPDNDMLKIGLRFAIDLIDLHLQFKETDVDKELVDMEKYYATH